MTTSIIRGKYVIPNVIDRHTVSVIEDGAVVQENGVVAAVGRFTDLRGKYRSAEVVGGGEDVVLPGFINAHHHVGLTPIQLGSLDEPLERWWITRIAERDVDPYLDTLYSAFEMIESGTTCVQHIYAWPHGGAEKSLAAMRRVIKAYEDIGMRVSFSFGMRDQNRVSLLSDEEVLARLPPDLAKRLGARFEALAISMDEQFEIFDELNRVFDQRDRVRVQLAPGNLHWCSDAALEALRACSEQLDAPMHIHLLETAYQKEYALRRTGVSAFRHLHDRGLTGPLLTLGHGVWLTEDDLDLAADTDTRICHNCSSNLRLRSGVAPLNAFEERKIKVAIGIDEAGINDDRDMLQEMRLVLKLHREPGMNDGVPTAAQVLRMATEHGAMTTPFANIGVLAPGRAADLVMIDWRQLAHPYLDAEMPVVEAVLHRAKTAGVRTVIIAGEPVFADGRFTRVDKEATLAELAAALDAPLEPHEKERRALARDLLAPGTRWYDGYTDPRRHLPFYRASSRT